MKIFVTGTRGVPNIPGGVESHCEKLYPLIVKMGHEVIIARRSTYINDNLDSWHGIQLVNIFTPRKKSIEAIIHTFLAILEARKHKPDLLHIHAIGPSIMVPFARILGLKVVVTNHGPDYDRQKWGWLAKKVLKFSEYLGCKFANEVIVISRVIEDIITKRCKRSSHLIYNGVVLPPANIAINHLESYGITPQNYIFTAARFVPEKGLHDLIQAFKNTNLDCHLVIAGDADHEDKYSSQLKTLAATDKRVLLTGFITGDKLRQFFQHAKLFILPSYHEGLPIALLEALSYGTPVLVSDIPANLEIDINKERYFKCGDVTHLSSQITRLWEFDMSPDEKMKIHDMLVTKYSWDIIAAQTVEVYAKTVG